VHFQLAYLAFYCGSWRFGCYFRTVRGICNIILLIRKIKIGFTLMNWNALDVIYGHPANKVMNLFFVIFIVMLNLMLGLASKNIDSLGHLGGLIFGFFLIWLVINPYQEDDGACCSNKIWYWLCLGMIVLMYLIFFTMFYALLKFPNNSSGAKSPSGQTVVNHNGWLWFLYNIGLINNYY